MDARGDAIGERTGVGVLPPRIRRDSGGTNRLRNRYLLALRGVAPPRVRIESSARRRATATCRINAPPADHAAGIHQPTNFAMSASGGGRPCIERRVRT